MRSQLVLFSVNLLFQLSIIVFVQLVRMPLTPNGKVDKNALPFPDTVYATASTTETEALTPTEKAVMQVWSLLLYSETDSASIPLDENFFDLGGHSILATRLIFEVRKKMGVNIPLSLIYQHPTIRGMSKQVEMLRGEDLVGNFALQEQMKLSRQGSVQDGLVLEEEYAKELDELYQERFADLKLPPKPNSIKHDNILVTGVTGFLGAFIVSSLLKRYPLAKIYCHVRAKSAEEGLARIIENMQRYLIWNPAYADSVVAVCGDLAQPKLGVDESLWCHLSETIDMIIHNGALVHWVFPYSKLKAPNVLGTVDALELAFSQKLKPFYFVSSTSVLDTKHYVDLEDVKESDDLSGSMKGLGSGYAQSKWVCERLIMRLRQKGALASIIRPGYVVGDSALGGKPIYSQ